MSKDNKEWAPRVVTGIKAKPEEVAAPVMVQLQLAPPTPAPTLEDVARVVAETFLARKEPASITKASGGWRFVPVRDANNLIVEIIATPI